MDFSEIDDETTNDYSSYWQSIPDPPTPTPAATEEAQVNPAAAAAVTRRSKRRDSLAPLKDVTNKSDGESGRGTVLKGEVLKSNGTTSGKFASSLFSELESSDDGDLELSRKSNKKRRSLSLPSDDGSDILAKSMNDRDGKGSPETATAGNPVVGSGETVTSTSLTDNCNQTNDSSKHNEIINLVRNYCSLPPEQRLDSYEAKQIESISGYPVPGTVLKLFDGDSETCKREFLLRAQPMVKAMEERKQKDIDDARAYTGCLVKRVKGEFQYQEAETLKSVSAEEYKARYSAMIDERKAQRRGEEKAEEKSFSEEASPFADDSNMDIDESVFSPDESLVHVDDDSSTVSSARLSGDCLTISSVGENDTSPAADAEHKEHATAVHRNDNASNSSLVTETVTSSHQSLINSLPPSDDPRVLEARRKLFRAIDTALATYSSEILALTRNDTDGGASAEGTN